MTKLRKTLSIILITTLLISCFSSFSFADVTEPKIEAKGAAIYCGTTGDLIWGKNENEKFEPASTTKLLTALVVLEHLNLEDIVKVTKEGTKPEPSKIYLQEGEELTVENLLYALLIPSANDAAVALAIATSGSVSEFSKLMNEKAKELGCENSYFVTPNGLEAEGHLSTAKDMSIIGAAAFKNPDIKKIAATKTYTIPETNKYLKRVLENHNLLLTGGKYEVDGKTITVNKYEGVFGGKTGTLGSNNCSMVVGFNLDGLDIYCTVMKTSSKARYLDEIALLDYAKQVVTKYTVFNKGEYVGKAKVKGGAYGRVKGIAKEDGNIILPEGASAALVTTKNVYSDNLTAPVKAGEKIGVVEIYIADELKRKIDIVAMNDVKEGWFPSKIGISNVATIVIGVVLFLILAFFLTITILRSKNKKKAAALKKKRIEEEARRRLEKEEEQKKRGWTFN